MPHSLSSYYYDELLNWDKSLELYETEILGFESKLSSLLHQNSVPHLAEKVEFFLNRFSILHIEFETLAQELHRQGSMLKNDDAMVDDSVVTNEITMEQDTIRKRMKSMEQNLIETKFNYQNFLADIHQNRN